MQSRLELSTRWFLVLILLLGALIRYSHNELAFTGGKVHSDARYYVAYARNIVNHSTFSMDLRNEPPTPDSYWAPGYPLLLALAFKASDLFGLNAYALVITGQLIIGVLTIFLTFLLAKTFLPGLWPLLPAMMVSISPHLISVGQNVLTETAFAFFLLLSLWLFISAVVANSLYRLLAAGVALATTWLVNPTSILITPLLALIYLRCNAAANRTNWKGLLLIVAPLVVTSTTWTMRNAFVVEEDSLQSSDRLLVNLIIGMHRNYYDIWRADKRDPNNPATLDSNAVDGSYLSLARLWLARTAEAPLDTLRWYGLEKPLMLWSWNVQIGYDDIYVYRVNRSIYDVSNLAQATYKAMRFLHPILLLFACLGLIFLTRPCNDKRWIVVTIYSSTISVSLVYVASQADPRYSFPLRPELYLCASFFIYSVGVCLHALAAKFLMLSSFRKS